MAQLLSHVDGISEHPTGWGSASGAQGGCAGRCHRVGVSKSSSPAVQAAVQAHCWTGSCVLLSWSPALQRLREEQNPGCSAEHPLYFRQGRSSPERC